MGAKICSANSVSKREFTAMKKLPRRDLPQKPVGYLMTGSLQDQFLA